MVHVDLYQSVIVPPIVLNGELILQFLAASLAHLAPVLDIQAERSDDFCICDLVVEKI